MPKHLPRLAGAFEFFGEKWEAKSAGLDDMVTKDTAQLWKNVFI